MRHNNTRKHIFKGDVPSVWNYNNPLIYIAKQGKKRTEKRRNFWPRVVKTTESFITSGQDQTPSGVGVTKSRRFRNNTVKLSVCENLFLFFFITDNFCCVCEVLRGCFSNERVMKLFFVCVCLIGSKRNWIGSVACSVLTIIEGLVFNWKFHHSFENLSGWSWETRK